MISEREFPYEERKGMGGEIGLRDRDKCEQNTRLRFRRLWSLNQSEVWNV